MLVKKPIYLFFISLALTTALAAHRYDVLRGDAMELQGPSVPFPTSTGALDATFGAGGFLTTAVGTANDIAQAVAIQADGKIVAAGFGWNGTDNDFAVVRYNPNGSLDDTFDGNGQGNGIVMTGIGSSHEEAFGVAIQPDGRIVAVGRSITSGFNTDLAAVRYNPNGTLDTTFDGDGRLTVPLVAGSDIARAAAIQPDGKIVIAGNASFGSDSDILLVRLMPNGTLDAEFDGDSGNGNGIITTSAGISDQGYGLVLQPDGKIVVAGYFFGPLSTDSLLLRYRADGRLDPSFGGDGIVTVSFSPQTDEALSVALQADGKIVIAGCIRDAGPNDFLFARFNPDGSLDGSFGIGGSQIVAFGSGPDLGLGVAIQTDGGIVSAGFASNGSDNDFSLARLGTGGSLDSTFDMDGRVQTMIGTSTDTANAVALQADGRIVVVGRVVVGGTADFGIARYGYGTDSQGSDGFFNLDSTTAIRFDNAFTSGTSSVTILNPNGMPPPPASFSFIDSHREIQTSALFNGGVFIKLTLPSNLDLAAFNAARVLQLENGAWTDKTVDSPARDFATKTIYARLSSLGVIAAVSTSPAAELVTVSGRVAGPSGAFLGNVTVTITDANNVRRTATTSSFGFYTFSDVQTGRSYTILVRSKRYKFVPRSLTVTDNVANLDFAGVE